MHQTLRKTAAIQRLEPQSVINPDWGRRVNRSRMCTNCAPSVHRTSSFAHPLREDGSLRDSGTA
jgi:hypothetical protein